MLLWCLIASGQPLLAEVPDAPGPVIDLFVEAGWSIGSATAFFEANDVHAWSVSVADDTHRLDLQASSDRSQMGARASAVLDPSGSCWLLPRPGG